MGVKVSNSFKTRAAFGDDLRLLARKAYCNHEQEAQETLALQQFCKAFSVEM
jgi:hypothetical protein